MNSLGNYSELLRYNLLIELFNEVSLKKSPEEIYTVISNKIKWIFDVNLFLHVKVNAESNDYVIQGIDRKFKEVYLYSNKSGLLHDIINSKENIIRLVKHEIDEKVFNDLEESVSNHDLKVMIAIKDVSQKNSNEFLLWGSNQESSFSKNEIIQLKTLSNIYFCNLSRVSLTTHLEQSNKELRDNIVELEDAQNKIQNQSELERIKNLYKALISTTASIIWTVNREGEFIGKQDEWSDFTGQSYDEYKGRGWVDALHPSDREKCLNAWLLASSSEQVLKTDGRIWSDHYQAYRYFETTGVPSYNKDGEVIEWIGNTTDVTDKLYHKAKLEETVVDLKKALNSKSMFLANVSHEVRTPLNSIVGFSDLALTEEDPVELKKSLKTINTTADYLLSLVSNLLDFSSLESKKIKLNLFIFNLEDLIQEIFDSIKVEVDTSGIDLILENGNDKEIKIYYDREKIKQVLVNLVSNSLKFTERGFVKIKTHYNYDTNILDVSVIDSGIGIEKHNIENVFNEFEQEDLSTIKKYKGVGLGLSIVHKLVSLMNGKVYCDSIKNKGTTFVISLPINIKKEKSSQENKIKTTVKIDESLSILVVDDSEDNIMLMKRYFSKTDLKVDFVFNGFDAIEHCEMNRYDLIFMDIQMPKMDGNEATVKIRKLNDYYAEKAKIIALSAHVNKESIDKMLDSGCDCHLAKPIRKSGLFEFINKLF